MSDDEKTGGGFRALLGVVIAVVAVGSAGMRWAQGDDAPKEPTAATSGTVRMPAGGSGFDVGGPTRPENRERDAGDDPLDDALPIVTEASFFGMLGFALGYFAKKVVKLALLFTGMLAFLLMGLQYFDIITIDWSRAHQLFNDVVLNIKENQSISDFMKDRLPGAGGLVGGYVIGFRKG